LWPLILTSNFFLMSLNTNTVGRGGGSAAVQTGLTASTTASQVGGLTVPLIAGVNNVTVSVANDDAVSLPQAVQGAVVIVKNSDAGQDIVVWPFTGDKVNAGTLNAADTTALGQTTGRMYVCVTSYTSSTAGDWVSLGLPVPAV
jgi:hypothetical protein